MPKIYVGTVEYTLPVPDRGNRLETFDKEVKTWTDLDMRLHERIKGYRLRAEYEWERLTLDELNTLLDIYNAANEATDIRIKFASFPRKYSVKIVGFEKGLTSGYGFIDAASMEFSGVDLLDAFPNPDSVYTMVPLLGRGLIVNSGNEQGI